MKKAGHRDLKFFLNLAQQKTADSRRTLFENVTDLFISENGRLSERERAQILAILGDLIYDVERQVRAGLAERLKERADVPSELAALLANDEIEIARPILIKSPALRDPDLIEIIRLRGQEYWLAITLRQSLSEEVSDAIIATQNLDVIQSLLQNHDARLSRSAMEYLVAEAERVDRLQNPLVRRHDLPPPLAIRMYWWVSAALRQHILRSFKLVPQSELAVDALIEEATDEALRADADVPSMSATARAFAERLAETTGITPDLLIQLLRSGRVPAVAAAFALACRLDEPLVRRLILSRDHESVAVLCRHVGFNRNEFATFFLLLSGANQGTAVTPPANLLGILQVYDDLTKEIAAAVLGYWRRLPAFSKAIAEIGEA